MNKKTNVVFILSDDQGYWTLGCGGNNDIRTPNLDRLASEGIRFDNFFCSSPVCSPARATLLTGRIPSQHGVLDWISLGGGSPQINPPEIEYLEGQTGYTDILAANGYTCGLSGKWHLGASYKKQKSFSHWFTFYAGSSKYYDANVIVDGEEVQSKGYLTDLIADDAIEFIDTHAGDDNPFYASVNFNAPHRPWGGNHPQEVIDSYDDCDFKSCPQGEPHPWLTPWGGEHDQTPPKENLKGYFAAITCMDAAIGRIIDKINELGIREDTLIIFSSDNGFNCGHHGIWGKGNGTFPQNMYDTSVKVPAIFSHKGTISEGVVCEDLVSGYDFMPTLIEYLGVESAQYDELSKTLPGRSFVPILFGNENPNRKNIVVYDEYGSTRMIRTKEWKYVHRYPFGPNELYDLVNDPGENINLFSDESKADVIVEMRANMEDWFFQYVDPALDGRIHGIIGNGQHAKLGDKSNGKANFDCDGEIDRPKFLWFDKF